MSEEAARGPRAGGATQQDPSGYATSASIGGQGAAGEWSYKDKDPPPSWDGQDPELTFRQFEKNVKLWEFETDIPERKRGIKLMRALTGQALLAVEDMEIEELTTDEGLKNVLKRLREYFMPHLEISLPRAFEGAVYGQPKHAKESFAEFVNRMERSFEHLKKEGVDLPDGARGYIMFRQALNENQEQRLLTWAAGKYSREEITLGLRRLDKVLKDKTKVNYFEENLTGTYDGAGECYIQEELEGEFDDDENYIYLEEGDLDQVMEESDVMAALASYREVRQALKDQKLGRGYFPEKGKGKGRGNGGKAKGRGKSRVHIEQLKLRTRCNKCLQIGHWERECPNPRAAGQYGSSSTVSSGTTNKSFLVQLGKSGSTPSTFWLRQFLEERRSLQCAGKRSSAELSFSSAYKVRSEMNVEVEQFCGIVTHPCEGVVDTAAEGGLIGSEPLARLQQQLRHHGLKVKWIPKKSTAKGVGGSATVEGVALIPLGIGGVNGILETTVVQGDVPLLLPVKLLKQLAANIDLKTLSMRLQDLDVTVKLHELPSGHVTVSIFQFAPGNFEVPVEAGSPEEFSADEKMMTSFLSAAMPAHQANSATSQFEKSANLSTRPHGGAASSSEEDGGHSKFWREAIANGHGRLNSSEASPEKLASPDGQSGNHPAASDTPVSHGRMVRRIGAAAACFGAIAGGGDARGLLFPGDHMGSISPNQGRTPMCNQCMCASESQPTWGRQWEEVLHSAQTLLKEKKVMSQEQGPLGQTTSMAWDQDERMSDAVTLMQANPKMKAGSPMKEHQMGAEAARQVATLQEELRQARMASQEKELRQEKMMQMLLQNQKEMREKLSQSSSSGLTPQVAKASANQPSPICASAGNRPRFSRSRRRTIPGRVESSGSVFRGSATTSNGSPCSSRRWRTWRQPHGRCQALPSRDHPSPLE